MCWTFDTCLLQRCTLDRLVRPCGSPPLATILSMCVVIIVITISCNGYHYCSFLVRSCAICKAVYVYTFMCIYIYIYVHREIHIDIYIYIHMYTYTYIYIYVYREREREEERDTHTYTRTHARP